MSAPLNAVEAQHWNAGPLGTEGDQSSFTGDSTSVSTDVASLSALDPAAQEVAVTMMLDQSRQWLERAKVSTTPAQDVAEFKAFVATVAEAAKQKKLSLDIQLDAVEMVRRSERALGVAIREGQKAGEIRARGEGAGRPQKIASGTEVITKPSPYDFATNAELYGDARDGRGNGIYAVTDDVSDEKFEEAITESKHEGNLSRANVARKVAEISTFKETQIDKWEQVAEFAQRGFTSPQIAKAVDMSEGGLRGGAKTRGIEFPADKIVGRSRRIDPLRVLAQIVASVEVTESSLDLVTYEDVTPEQASEWLELLTPGIKALRALEKTLKEIK